VVYASITIAHLFAGSLEQSGTQPDSSPDAAVELESVSDAMGLVVESETESELALDSSSLHSVDVDASSVTVFRRGRRVAAARRRRTVGVLGVRSRRPRSMSRSS
jgi:hypothetical protein